MAQNGGGFAPAERGGVDMNLYSRQIGTFGVETMGKLVAMRVLLSGMRGTGVEVAKNLCLAGPAAVLIHDDAVCETRDLGANFYITEKHVQSKMTRADAVVDTAMVEEGWPRDNTVVAAAARVLFGH